MAIVREKTDIAYNALKYKKTEIIDEKHTLPELNTNKSGNFSESTSLEKFFKNLPFFMNWEMLIPSMTAVYDDLQKFSLLVLKALIYAKQTPQKRKLNSLKEG